jgi:hypothetical protein
MTATITPTTATATIAGPDAGSTRIRPLWKAGAGAGLVAAGATVAVAAAAHGLGVKLETAPGQAIPILGFGQLTLFFTAVGVLLARGIGRRAGRPRATLVRTTVALTALSLVPDVLISAGVATKATFMLTHLVAAAIVIPVLASRLPEHRTS